MVKRPQQGKAGRQASLAKGSAAMHRLAALPLWKRLTTLTGVAVLLAAVSTITDVAGFFGVSSSSSPSPALEIAALRVTEDGEVDQIWEEQSMEGGPNIVTERPGYATLIDMVVRNSGDTAEVVDGLLVTVTRAEELENCEATGGTIAISGEYDLGFPPDTAGLQGAQFSTSVTHEVPARGTDRIALSVGEAEPQYALRGRLLHLQVELSRGANMAPMAVGEVLAISPSPFVDPSITDRYNSYFLPEVGGACAQHNHALLEEFAALGGENSDAVQAYLAGREPILPARIP